jgi:GT2 family glycosyltransferase
MNGTISVLMAVHNGASWLDGVLQSIARQTRRPQQVLIRDNASTDETVAIVGKYPWATLIAGADNIGPWAAFEQLLDMATGSFVACLTDVVLDTDYLLRTAQVLESDDRIGAVQGMLLHPTLHTVDGYGFAVSRSRAVTIDGHGEVMRSEKDPFEIFGVEGAAPVFRRTAIEDIRVLGWFVDPAYRIGPLGYGDDLDIAWRLRLRGWKQLCIPAAIGYHDRSTTNARGTSLVSRIRRRHVRGQIAVVKRQLDWANVRFTVIKNDAMMDILRDIWRILGREVLVQGYTLLFEPAVLLAWGRFLRLLPRMLAVRRKIRSRSIIVGGSVRSALT